MKILIHPNYLISIGLVLISIFAIAEYAKDQKKNRSFANLTAQTMQGDLPRHRMRAAPTGPIHLDPRVNEMLAQLRAENFQDALEGVRELILTQPNNVALHYYAGSLAHRLGDLESAKGYLQLVRMNSDLFYADALKKLALIYYSDQQPYLCRQMLEDLNPIANSSDLEWSQQLRELL